jgi:hypothetical protein
MGAEKVAGVASGGWVKLVRISAHRWIKLVGKSRKLF